MSAERDWQHTAVGGMHLSTTQNQLRDWSYGFRNDLAEFFTGEVAAAYELCSQVLNYYAMHTLFNT